MRVQRGVAACWGHVVGVRVCPAERPWGVLEGQSIPRLDQRQATDQPMSMNNIFRILPKGK